MGSGGPSTRTIVEAADITRTKGPKRVGPFAVPKAMSSTASATLATWFKIKGVNYSISSACATSNHCIGNASEIIQLGKQDMIFAGGCEELDWTLSVLFDAMGAMSSKYNETPAKASRAYDVATATASSSPAAPACWCWKNSSTPRRAARRSMPRSSATARPRTATTWWRRRAKAPCAACRWRSTTVKAPVDYINPHATSTPIGDLKEIEAIREVFGAKCPPISATKSLTGHSLGAAGVQEAIYSLLMMSNGFICESANIENSIRPSPTCRSSGSAATTSSSAACCRIRSASAAPTPSRGVQAAGCMKRVIGKEHDMVFDASLPPTALSTALSPGNRKPSYRLHIGFMDIDAVRGAARLTAKRLRPPLARAPWQAPAPAPRRHDHDSLRSKEVSPPRPVTGGGGHDA